MKHAFLFIGPTLALCAIAIYFISGGITNSTGLRINSEQKQHAKFTFKEYTHDFGVINDGDTVSHAFHFTNGGTAPLVISDISTACGCTVVEWSNNPIPPRKEGDIVVQFSKHHDPGVHFKTAIIKANTEDPYTILRIRANVKKQKPSTP